MLVRKGGTLGWKMKERVSYKVKKKVGPWLESEGGRDLSVTKDETLVGECRRR
jgi:hypothetical protein